MHTNVTERILLGLLAAFLIFTLGFFLGRSTARPAVTVQVEESSNPAKTSDAHGEEDKATRQERLDETVDVNTADLQALQALPGIGPVLAQRILDYREQNGPFASVSELTKVEGIGEKTLSEILQYIKVG